MSTCLFGLSIFLIHVALITTQLIAFINFNIEFEIDNVFNIELQSQFMN